MTPVPVGALERTAWASLPGGPGQSENEYGASFFPHASLDEALRPTGLSAHKEISECLMR